MLVVKLLEMYRSQALQAELPLSWLIPSLCLWVAAEVLCSHLILVVELVV